MSSMMVEIDNDLFDTAMAAELRRAYYDFKNPKPEHTWNIWSDDPAIEAKKRKEMIKALRLVHNWWALPVDHIKKDDS